MPLYPGGFSQLYSKDQGEKKPTGFSDTGEGEGPRGKGMDAPGWSGSASLCSLLWRYRSLSFHRTAPPSQASSLTTLLLFWILHQQALVGRQDTGFSELSWLTSSHLGRVGVHALCAFYNFGCLCHPACFIRGWWWVVLNRMPICFLHRQERLLHMGCQLCLEAQIEFTTDITLFLDPPVFPLAARGT